MNTGMNAFLQTAATALVALGISSISGNLWTGVIELVLGIACYVVYEKV